MTPIRIFQRYVHIPFLVLGILEFGIFSGSVYAGAYLRFLGDPEAIQWSIGPLLPRALSFAVVMMLSMIAMGLYEPRLRHQVQAILLRVLASYLLGGMAVVLLFYTLPYLYLGRGALTIAVVVSFLLVSAVRLLFLRVVDENVFKRRVLVFGTGEKAMHFTRLRRRSDQRGFMIVGFVHVGRDLTRVDGDKVLHLDSPLVDFARERGVDEIVVAVDDSRMALPVQELLECKLSGINVVDALTFFERETARIRLGLLYPSWMVFSDGFPHGTLRGHTERMFDMIVSLLLLVVTWPIMVVTAVAILVESGFRGPVLYRQERVGVWGKVFHVLKFRSMRVDAEQDGLAQWAEQKDSRVTRVGAVIRKLRIDELPQVFNVLRGDMGFVGPRPERPQFVATLSERIPYYRERHCVKPGITGWAQLSYPYASSEQDAIEKLQYDLYYIKNHSLLLDLQILLQTAEVVLFGRGAR